MKNRSEWDTFYQSGKVEDYLTYCHKKEKRETVEPDRGLKEKDAEFYSGFRSGVEGRTDWGI